MLGLLGEDVARSLPAIPQSAEAAAKGAFGDVETVLISEKDGDQRDRPGVGGVPESIGIAAKQVMEEGGGHRLAAWTSRVETILQGVGPPCPAEAAQPEGDGRATECRESRNLRPRSAICEETEGQGAPEDPNILCPSQEPTKAPNIRPRQLRHTRATRMRHGGRLAIHAGSSSGNIGYPLRAQAREEPPDASSGEPDRERRAPTGRPLEPRPAPSLPR